MKKLKSVLIGCGMIAREHLAAIAELENVEVAAVCDLSPARAEAAAERFGIAKWYPGHEQLLANVQPDLVHITTPPSSHFSIAKTCLSAGLNVLCEKPITIDYDEFVILKRLATDNHCTLMENQNLRFNSSVRRIFDLISSGKLGDVVDIQICISLNIFAPGSSYLDQNAAHFSSELRAAVLTADRDAFGHGGLRCARP
jgi:predicted dehydrogenase